jgi:tetratricopeptide (TPR) repeat protein
LFSETAAHLDVDLSYLEDDDVSEIDEVEGLEEISDILHKEILDGKGRKGHQISRASGLSLKEIDELPYSVKIKEMIKDAQIYINEEMFDEARALCEKILKDDSGNKVAKELLELSSQQGAERVIEDLRHDKEGRFQNVDRIIRNLEKDFDIDLRDDREIKQKDVHSLIKNTQAQILKRLSPQDSRQCLDLGIAFYEMGLYDAAMDYLKKASVNPHLMFSSMSLIAHCNNKKGNYLEAIAALESLLADRELSHHQRITLYYDLADIYESMGDLSKAYKYYKKVYEIDNKFRNVDIKIKELKTG